MARSAVGEVSGAIGGQALPAAPSVAADLLEPIGDPTKGDVLANAVFPDGPSRYGYARQAALTKIDPNGLQASAVCVLGGPANPACEVGVAIDMIGAYASASVLASRKWRRARVPALHHATFNK